MIKRVLSLSLVMLIAGPLQAGRVLLDQAMIVRMHKQIACEYREAKKSHTWSKVGLGALAITTGGIVIYHLFSGRQQPPAPVVQNNGQKPSQQEMIEAIYNRLGGQIIDPNQSWTSWLTSGSLEFGRMVGIFAGLGCVQMLASYLSTKIHSALNTAMSYEYFGSFVTLEQFDKDCEHLAHVIARHRLAPGEVSEEDLQLFVTTYDMFVKKIARLCGFLSWKAGIWKARHQMAAAKDLENCMRVMCEHVQKCTPQIEGALQKASQAERVEACTTAVAQLIEQINNKITHAKWVEQTAQRDSQLLFLARNT